MHKPWCAIQLNYLTSSFPVAHASHGGTPRRTSPGARERNVRGCLKRTFYYHISYTADSGCYYVVGTSRCLRIDSCYLFYIFLEFEFSKFRPLPSEWCLHHNTYLLIRGFISIFDDKSVRQLLFPLQIK